MDRHGQAAIRAGLGVGVSERTEPVSSAEGAGLVQKALGILPSRSSAAQLSPRERKGAHVQQCKGARRGLTLQSQVAGVLTRL